MPALFTILSEIMEISNQKRSKKIKQLFNLIGIAIVLIGLVFLWLKMDILLLVTAIFFAVYIGFAQFATLYYVYFSTSNGKVVIRYYPVISLLKKEYESIEFQHQALLSFRLVRSMGFTDLEIVIKTRRGVAEYPPISLVALRKSEIELIEKELNTILDSRLGS